MRYEFEVRESMLPAPLNGEIEADSREQAIERIIEFYTAELGTGASELEITILSEKE